MSKLRGPLRGWFLQIFVAFSEILNFNNSFAWNFADGNGIPQEFRPEFYLKKLTYDKGDWVKLQVALL